MTDNSIFVFGSNLAGRHGKGAALFAMRNHGAIYGKGEGLQGNSYAIPTKDARMMSLSLDEIANNVDRFKKVAASMMERKFLLTPIGCGLAGYRPEQIAPMFFGVSKNVIIPKEFHGILNSSTNDE